MEFGNPYWGNKVKIELLQKWILIHSIIYYTLDTSLVEDKVFDNNGKQLTKLMKTYPDEARKSKWNYVFKGFNGSTGFDLYAKLRKNDKKELNHIASYLVDRFGKNK